MLLVTVTPSISREKGETTAEYYSKNEDITKGTTYYNRDWYNNVENYQFEKPNTNRSHKHE